MNHFVKYEPILFSEGDWWYIVHANLTKILFSKKLSRAFCSSQLFPISRRVVFTLEKEWVQSYWINSVDQLSSWGGKIFNNNKWEEILKNPTLTKTKLFCFCFFALGKGTAIFSSIKVVYISLHFGCNMPDIYIFAICRVHI